MQRFSFVLLLCLLSSCVEDASKDSQEENLFAFFDSNSESKSQIKQNPFSIQLEVIKPYVLRVFLKVKKPVDDRIFLLVFLDEKTKLETLTDDSTDEEKNRSITIAFQESKEMLYHLFYKKSMSKKKSFNVFQEKNTLRNLKKQTSTIPLSGMANLLASNSGEGVVSFEKKTGGIPLIEQEYTFDIFLNSALSQKRWKLRLGWVSFNLFNPGLKDSILVDTVDFRKVGKVTESKIFLRES